MTGLERMINEVASSLSEKEISTTKKNVDTLLEEITVQNGAAKLIMIAWDQQ